MKRFIAFSGGVESSTMCLLYGKDATPVFTDTKYEHQPMYERIDLVEKALKIIHGDQFSVVRICRQHATEKRDYGLPEYIADSNFYPNPNARFCTRLFKIEVLDDFLRDQGDCELMIGLNYDEADDRVGNLGKCKNVNYTYPLVEAKKTRGDCEAHLSEYGLLPRFPAYMRRGGCKGCFFKRKSEYAIMAKDAYEEAIEVAEIEESIQDKRSDYYHIHQEIPNMRRFIENVRSQKPMFPEETEPQIYSYGQSCGVFCHR